MRIDLRLLIALNATAVRHSVDLVSTVAVEDLPRRTPCAAWTLADLLAHMTAQHRGFAAAAAGAGHDLTHWVVRPIGDDPVACYRDEAERVLTAFAEVDSAEHEFALPEFGPDRRFPAATAIGFHLLDYLVHSWDVATALGRPFTPAPEVVEAALPIALAVPGGQRRLDPGSPFGPAMPTPAGVTAMEHILLTLGRSPSEHAPDPSETPR